MPLIPAPIVAAGENRARTSRRWSTRCSGSLPSSRPWWSWKTAHWIDPTTLELIQQCLDRTAAARVMILLTSGRQMLTAKPRHNRFHAETITAIIARTDGGASVSFPIDQLLDRLQVGVCAQRLLAGLLPVADRRLG
jgi:hypothetical protein